MPLVEPPLRRGEPLQFFRRLIAVFRERYQLLPPFGDEPLRGLDVTAGDGQRLGGKYLVNKPGEGCQVAAGAGQGVAVPFPRGCKPSVRIMVGFLLPGKLLCFPGEIGLGFCRPLRWRPRRLRPVRVPAHGLGRAVGGVTC